MRSYPALDYTLFLVAFLFTPALWPLAFITVAVVFPDAIDPLLGGAQDSLYMPGLIWLIGVLLSTALIARVFRLKKTNRLFLIVAVGSSVAIVACILIVFLIQDILQIGSPSLVYPASVDDVINFEALVSLVQAITFVFVVSLVTALSFVLMGGVRLWKADRGKEVV